MGAYSYPPGTATVEPGNPVGGAFTLPTKAFVTLQGTYSITPKTGWPGYTTYTYVDYYNGPAKFGPNHGPTTPVRVVFPTTGNNPYPNYGLGQPVTPTTTFNGQFDFERVGSINVTPGPNRFGGTYRYFYGPTAGFYQFVYYFSPAIYKAYGNYTCLDEGKFGCTKDTFVSTAGDITAIYTITNFLLNVKGTGTGDRLQSSTAKATTVAGNGGYPTVNGQGTPLYGGQASYITRLQQYLNLIHPWTTGFASVKNPVGSPNIITPQYQGYDIDLQGQPKLTVTRVDPDQVWNKTLSTLSTTTETFKSYMYNVGRVVSLVRPRLIHTYAVPLQGSTDPITMTWPVARMWRLKVYFLPEPAGMLLLGSGIVGLLGLSRMRRR
jgi:hypothetical protein